MLGVKKVGAANATQSAQRSAEVLVIARGHDAAASLAETRDALAVGDGQTIAGINRKQPQLVKTVVSSVLSTGSLPAASDSRSRVVTSQSGFPASSFQRSQLVPQQREPADVPVVFGKRNGGLH